MQRSTYLAALILGLLSGIGSWLTVGYRPDLFAFAAIIPGGAKVTWLPGALFGLAVAIGLRATAPVPLARLMLALGIVHVGWGVGYHAAMTAGAPIEALVAGPNAIPDGFAQRLSFALAMTIGSLIGGALTLLACTLAADVRLSRAHWLSGLALGVMVVFMVALGVGFAEENRFWLSLFALWQITMLVSGMSAVAEARAGTRPLRAP
jgi:hypothetical protein